MAVPVLHLPSHSLAPSPRTPRSKLQPRRRPTLLPSPSTIQVQYSDLHQARWSRPGSVAGPAFRGGRRSAMPLGVEREALPRRRNWDPIPHPQPHFSLVLQRVRRRARLSRPRWTVIWKRSRRQSHPRWLSLATQVPQRPLRGQQKERPMISFRLVDLPGWQLHRRCLLRG